MQMVNYTMESMVAKCQTEVLYTDFEKAFDRANHKRLLQKLIGFGFGRGLAKWFHAWPCLFIVFINVIVDHITDVAFLLFADDLEFILKLSSPADARIFPHAIDQLYDWVVLG